MSALSELYTVPQEQHLDLRDAVREIAQQRRRQRIGRRPLAGRAEITQIHEGTNEIQRLVVARTLR